MLRIVRWCGMLCIGVALLLQTQCGPTPRLAPGERPINSYANCGPVQDHGWAEKYIPPEGDSIQAGPHWMVFSPDAFAETTRVRLREISDPQKFGVQLQVQGANTGSFGADVIVRIDITPCNSPPDSVWGIFRVRGSVNNQYGRRLDRRVTGAAGILEAVTRDHSFFIVAD